MFNQYLNQRPVAPQSAKVATTLVLLMLIAFALRLPAIGRDSLWFDEAFTYFIAANLSWQEILTNKIQSAHPPLYYFFLHYWLKLVPDSDGAGRLLSLFWSVAFVPLVYLLARQFLPGRRLASLAAFMAAVSPFIAIYSSELRMYTQALFLVTAGTLAYVYAVKRERPLFWGLFIAAFTAALYTHLFAVFALAGVGLHGLLIRSRQPRSFWLLIGATAVVGLLFLPWIIVILSDWGNSAGSLRPLTGDRFIFAFDPVKPLRMLTYPLFGASDSFGLHDSILYKGVALFLTLWLLIILSLEFRKAARAGELDVWQLFPALMLGAIVGLPSLLYYLRPFFLPDRSVTIALPYLLILVTWGVTRRASPLPWTVYLTILTMIVGSGLYLAGDNFKEPYRQTAAYILQHYEPGDTVLHTHDFSYLPVMRYTRQANFAAHARIEGDLPRPSVVYETINGALWPYQEVARIDGRIWLIIPSAHKENWQRSQAAYFLENYFLLAELDFDGVAVYLFASN
jgi:mannosyltransferase